jgi:hypothetical protein
LKLIFAFLFLIRSSSAFGQELKYLGSVVDTIEIRSELSRYQFDEQGTTIGFKDQYLIVFDTVSKRYVLRSYKKGKEVRTFRTGNCRLSEKSIMHSVSVDRVVLNRLLKQLEIKYCKPALVNFGMTQERFLNLTNRHHIKQVAKKYRMGWKFKRAYSYKEERVRIIRSCQNVDTFNLFLSISFDTTHSIVIADFSQFFSIRIATGQECFRFFGAYPNLYKQPWHLYSSSDPFFENAILNFGINEMLNELLPKGFLRLETLQFEALTNEYIKWYLKHQDIIF